jgi:hypothetical protein
MDKNLIPDLIETLRHRLQVVRATIAGLERRTQPIRSSRGRRSMGPEERMEVSARMRRYWAKKQKR